MEGLARIIKQRTGKLMSYPFATIPEDLVDISRRRGPLDDGLHPPNNPTLIQCAPHIRRASWRQFRDPQFLGRVGIMHADDLVDRLLRIGLVHVQGDDGDLVDAARAVAEEVGQVATPREGDSGRDELRARGRVDEVLKRGGGVGGARHRGEAHVAVVGLVEELEIGGWVGRGYQRFGGGDVSRVHGDADLSRVDGARDGWFAVRRRLGERVDGKANCRDCVSIFELLELVKPADELEKARTPV